MTFLTKFLTKDFQRQKLPFLMLFFAAFSSIFLLQFSRILSKDLCAQTMGTALTEHAHFYILALYNALASLLSVTSFILSCVVVLRAEKKGRAFCVGIFSTLALHFLSQHFLEHRVHDFAQRYLPHDTLENFMRAFFQTGLIGFPAGLWGLVIGFGMSELHISFEQKDKN